MCVLEVKVSLTLEGDLTALLTGLRSCLSLRCQFFVLLYHFFFSSMRYDTELRLDHLLDLSDGQFLHWVWQAGNITSVTLLC